MMNRRQLLVAGAAAVTGLTTLRNRSFGQQGHPLTRAGIPLVHITDLYHPPQDPDDHIDLATVVALDEYDLKGIILDVNERFLNASPAGSGSRHDPGFIPVTQMAYMLGRTIPVAAGPSQPLTSPQDDVATRTPREQAGVHLLLDVLERSDRNVVVSIVGSARVITAAYNRNPDLLRSKIQAVLLNAGSTGGKKLEWNVDLDPEAYKGLWRTGLPIHWYPCATERSGFDPDHERSSYWKTTHAALFRDLSPTLQSWFFYALSRDTRSDFIHLLSEKPPQAAWDALLLQERNLWSTVSLVMEAGRVLAKTSAGWRFVSARAVETGKVWPWRLDRIKAAITEQAEVRWQTSAGEGNALLFGREKGPAFGEAMSEALNGLLGSVLK
jgi:hypothetical protein